METATLLSSQLRSSTGRGSIMSCFTQIWRTEVPESPPPSPTSPVPAAPHEIPIPLSPIVITSPSASSHSSESRPSVCSPVSSSVSSSVCSPVSSSTSPSIRSPIWSLVRSPVDGKTRLGSPTDRPTSPIECSICFNTYDNLFKTPKVLRCNHTFCLECLARLAAARPRSCLEDELPCPFCRQITEIPLEGPPGLQTSKDLMATLPPEHQREKMIWMEGTKICCRQSSDPENADACISIDIAPSKPEVPQLPPETFMGRLTRCDMCDDWKRVLLLSVLIIILFCIILWPLHCAMKTGNLRCFARTYTRPSYVTYHHPTTPAPTMGSVGPAE
uniref:Ring finger protein 223 n=1 Tax=Anolis carolinensis TaxID=28377 RepID=H9GHV4_ANOCA|nr:PREDICTED: RING finger protein 223 isoform X1 [Anolis carolinensis]|eukprot:XP_016853470.1 PREDICTED: RING finger protein 223 isoform X1 [Anolis carolinensis]